MTKDQEDIKKSINKVDTDVKWVVGILVGAIITSAAAITGALGYMVNSSEARVTARIVELENSVTMRINRTDDHLRDYEKAVSDQGQQIAVLNDRYNRLQKDSK